MPLTPPERETVLTLNDEDDVLHIYTTQRKIITALRKNSSATLLDEGKHDGSVWAEFELPVNLFRLPASKRRTGRPMGEEHKKLLADARKGLLRAS